MTPTPPRWAELLLRACLKRADVETVSGDLLEEYRDAVYPAHGQSTADTWYVMQVLGFLVRRTWLWALLFAAAYVTRTALDWLAPPASFQSRSAVSTFVGFGVFLGVGLWTSARSRSFVTGLVAGAATAGLAAGLSILGAGLLLAIWHDAATLMAIDSSGGISEVFEMPILMIVPGAILGTIGGVVGVTIARCTDRAVSQ
jgi:hypothetical protein